MVLFLPPRNTLCDRPHCNMRRRRCRVAIVGAGASGLSAAQALIPILQHDAETPSSTSSNDTAAAAPPPPTEPLLILEARSRIGGRIQTAPLSDGTIVDMGAAWVHGTGVPYLHNGKGKEEELNPMVRLLQQRADLSDDDVLRHEDPLRAGLVYTSPRGNPDTRPRDVLHCPATASHKSQLIELNMGGKQISQDDDDIAKALDLYERILASASRIGSAAYDCGEGMAVANLSIGKTIDMIRSNAPKYYGLGFNVNGTRVESLLGYYLHSLQVWHPHDLANVQLAEFIMGNCDEDDDSFDSNEDSVRGVENLGGEEGDFPGPHCNVQKGLASILEPLQSNGVRECILCDQEVTKIEQMWTRNANEKSTSVIITCESSVAVEADFCIVTIPVVCLKDAVNKHNGLFRPRLSQEKEEAIDMLQMGSYKKVYMIFDQTFWSLEPNFFGLIRKEVNDKVLLGESRADGLGNYLSVDNTIAKNEGRPILEVTLAGMAAKWACGRSDEEIRSAVLAFMDESMHAENILHPFSSRCVGCHITRWEEDRFAKGAYAGFKLGTMERHAASLAEPEWDGALLFSGDAIIPEYEGSVHGALLSGTKAAETIIRFLSSRTSKANTT